MRGRWPHPELPQPFRANETGDAAPDHRHPLVIARGHGGDDAVRTPVRRPVSLHSRDDLWQAPSAKSDPESRPARKARTQNGAATPHKHRRALPSTAINAVALLQAAPAAAHIPIDAAASLPNSQLQGATDAELELAARGQQSPPRCLGTPALGPSASHRCASRRARRAQRPAATSLPARAVTRTKHSSSMSRYGVPTLRKLRFQYCDWGGSSSGMR